MVYVRFLGCGGSERVVQRRNSPYLEIHSSESALHKSKNSLALDDLRFSKKWHYLPDGIVHRGWLPLYLHGKTCWFTAWENSNQIKNSGPVFFWPGIAFTIDTNQFRHVPKKGAKAWNSGIIDGFEEMEYEFSFGTFRLELKIMTIHFQIFHCSWRFSQVLTQKSCSVYFPTRFLGNVLWIVNNQCFPSVDGICM